MKIPTKPHVKRVYLALQKELGATILQATNQGKHWRFILANASRPLTVSISPKEPTHALRNAIKEARSILGVSGSPSVAWNQRS